MDKCYKVKFLNKAGEVRTFLQGAPNLDIATNKVCSILEDHIANASHDLMHLETIEVK